MEESIEIHNGIEVIVIPTTEPCNVYSTYKCCFFDGDKCIAPLCSAEEREDNKTVYFKLK